MIPLTITTNLELDPWTDLHPIRAQLVESNIERIGVLPNGTQNGKACVEFLMRTADGQTVVAETTLALFRMAAAAVLATPIAQMEDL